MQYLKDDVKQKIIESALAQFKEKGYSGASMRVIASNAGIVSGNIYRYFKNKEDLFNSAVEPVYELVKGIELLLKKSSEDAIQSAGSGNFETVREVTMKILEIFSGYVTELLVLINKSQGTKYAGTKENIKSLLSGVIKKTYVIQSINGDEINGDFMIYVLSSSYIDGFNLILTSNADDEKRIKEMVNSWINIIFCDLQNRI